MKVKFTDVHEDNNRTKGTADGYTFTAKLFDEGSIYGIDEGRVSKLEIRDCSGIIITHYDRDWDIEPTAKNHQDAFKAVIKFLENSPMRFA